MGGLARDECESRRLRRRHPSLIFSRKTTRGVDVQLPDTAPWATD